MCVMMITKNKEVGGLGIKSLYIMNLAFMAKLGWRIREEKYQIWAKAILVKYGADVKNLQEWQIKKTSSNAWKGTVAAVSTLSKVPRKLVRNGKNTRFRLESWLSEAPLCNCLCKSISFQELYAYVFDYWENDHGWN